MSPSSSPEGTAGLVRILLLVLANQITACRILLGINYLASLDYIMADDVELILNGIRENFGDN